MKKWTLEEDNIIRDSVKLYHGMILAAFMNAKINLKHTRTRNAIESRYYSYIKPQDDEANLIKQSKQNINTMKTTFKPLVKATDRSYPYIGKHKKYGHIIIFTSMDYGVLLATLTEEDRRSIGRTVDFNELDCDVIPNCTITFES